MEWQLTPVDNYYAAAETQLQRWVISKLQEIQREIETQSILVFGEGKPICFSPKDDAVWPLYFERVKTLVENAGYYCDMCPMDAEGVQQAPILMVSVSKATYRDQRPLTAFIKVTWRGPNNGSV